MWEGFNHLNAGLEDTIHYFWNLCLIRFIQNEQILHGTVAGTDVYLADFLWMACSIHERAYSSFASIVVERVWIIWREAFMRILFQVCCLKSSTSPWWRNTRLSRTALRAKYRKFRRSWSKQKRPLLISDGLSGSSGSISSTQSWRKRWRVSWLIKSLFTKPWARSGGKSQAQEKTTAFPFRVVFKKS